MANCFVSHLPQWQRHDMGGLPAWGRERPDLYWEVQPHRQFQSGGISGLAAGKGALGPNIQRKFGSRCTGGVASDKGAMTPTSFAGFNPIRRQIPKVKSARFKV